MSRFKQEQTIKNYLHMLGLQEQLQMAAYNPAATQMFPARQLSHKISDWANRCELSLAESASLPKLLAKNNRKGGCLQQSKSMEFAARGKPGSVVASPVLIHFGQKATKNSLRKSQLLFHKILHGEAQQRKNEQAELSDYLCHDRPQERSPSFECGPPPKTERISSILRMLKRQEQMRILRRKKEIPEALRSIKLQRF